MPALRNPILALIVALCCAHSHGLNVLVQTTARSAAGEPVGVVQQIVNLESGKAIPGAITLPGAVALHPTRYTASGAFGMVTVGPLRGGGPKAPNARTVLATFRASPLDNIANDLLSRRRGWKITGAMLIEDASSPGDTIVLLERTEEPGEDAGRLTILHGDLASGKFPEDASSTWDLDGIPIDATLLPDGTTLAVLCEEPGTANAYLHLRNVLSAEIVEDALDLRSGEGQFGSAPVALTTSPGGSHLIVLTSGYQIQQSSGEISSWVHVLDSATLSEPEPPRSLPGTALLSEDPLRPGHGDSLWIATRSAGAGFAYATHLKLIENRSELAVHVSFSGVDQPLKLAVAPSGSAVAVAAAERLEVWPDGSPGGAARTRTFKAPIGSLEWSAYGIFVGEGGRIYRLDPETLATWSSVQLQTGHVSEIRPLPEAGKDDLDGDGLSRAAEVALGTSVDSPDTDRDGIPDGVDPEPLVPSPRLQLPAAVTLRGEAAGIEAITFLLDEQQASPLDVSYDQNAMRWLNVRSEVLSFQPPRLTFSLDPTRYPSTEDEWVSGVITVRLAGTRPGTQAAGSPARIVVDVAPSRGRVRRVLWVWSEREEAHSLRSPTSAQRFSELAEMLAGPPFHYSHQGVWGPFEEPVEPYDAVFLTMEAAIEGALTRHVILDYVAHGGALLFIAGLDEARASEGIERWLEPAGITLVASSEVQGTFESAQNHEVVRNWDSFSIRGACEIQADENVTIAVPVSEEGRGAVLALRDFGFGRIAVLASGTPLEDRAIREPKHARFAGDLFRWLVSGRYAIQDQDADNLPDYIEDADGNGDVNAGETDFLDADSDDDGIPDGAEDVNGNGKVDLGETNPRNPDSDSDGILDGADAFPLPPLGMPQITSLDPQSGPAEGGTFVELYGLNFTANSAVWFGDQRSETVRLVDAGHLIAVAPASQVDSAEALVTIRVEDPASDGEAHLPSAFRYTLRSQVGLGMDLLRVTRRQYQTYSGAMSIVLDAPDIKVGRVELSIFVSPVGAIDIDRIRLVASPQLRAAHRTVSMRGSSPSSFRVVLSPGLPLSGRLNLYTVQWSTSRGLDESQLRFEIRFPFVAAQMGGAAKVTTHPLSVNLLRPAVPRFPPG